MKYKSSASTVICCKKNLQCNKQKKLLYKETFGSTCVGTQYCTATFRNETRKHFFANNNVMIHTDLRSSCITSASSSFFILSFSSSLSDCLSVIVSSLFQTPLPEQSKGVHATLYFPRKRKLVSTLNNELMLIFLSLIN